MWEGLIASAAGSKVASLGVGISVLLGGGAGIAEVTDIGPQVSSIVSPLVSSDGDSDEIVEVLVEETPEASPTPEAESNEAELTEEEIDAVDEENGREHYVVAADDSPGNLVWHLKDEAFHLRGLLVDADGTIKVQTAGPDGEFVELTIDEDVDINVPGGAAKDADEPVLEDLVGHLVRATGVCTDELPAQLNDSESDLQLVENSEGSEATEQSEESIALSTDSCTVTSIQILGNAGRPDADDSELTEETDTQELSEISDDSTDDSDGDAPADEESDPDQDDGHGKPDHAGGPKSKD